MDYLHSLPRQAKFRLGSLYVTAAVDRDIDFADVGVALSRHVHGDWGDVCEEDREANEFSLIARKFDAHGKDMGELVGNIDRWLTELLEG